MRDGAVRCYTLSMKSRLSRQVNPTALHHAYLFEGVREGVLADIADFIESDLSMPLAGNPDIFSYTHDSFSVEDARALQEKHVIQPVLSERKIMIIATYGISEAAQNALLKMFEEPIGHTVFFFVVPSAHILLPTLRSRLLHIRHESASELSGASFLVASYAERATQIKTVMDAISDEKKVRRDAIDLIESIIVSYRERVNLQQASTTERKVLKELLRIRDFAYDPSAPLKMLLEYSALLIPKVEG